MRHGLYLAPFGELAHPGAVAEVAALAEASGFDGVYLWDHMWRPGGRVAEVADVWVALAAAASATTLVRLGPMVVPLSRRRPQKVARETVSLDLLSGGRLTVGVGLGVDTGGELSRLGEVADDRARAAVLDEALELLQALWGGDEVHHHGERFVADAVTFLPRPLQRPRIPLWGAARGASSLRPVRRAARLDGLFPVGATRAQLESMLACVRSARPSLEGFDVAVAGDPDDEADLERLGVTWRLTALHEGMGYGDVVAAVREGPG